MNTQYVLQDNCYYATVIDGKPGVTKNANLASVWKTLEKAQNACKSYNGNKKLKEKHSWRVLAVTEPDSKHPKETKIISLPEKNAERNHEQPPKEPSPESNVVVETKMTYATADMFLQILSELNQMARDLQLRQAVLLNSQHQIELEIQDIEHAAEFYNLNAFGGYQNYKLMHDARKRRREVKDEIQKTQWILECLDINKNAAGQAELEEKFATLVSRNYVPRALPELFLKEHN